MAHRVPPYAILHDPRTAPRTTTGRAVFAELLGAPATAGGLTLIDVDFPAGTRLGSHWHTADLAAAVTEGSLTFDFGDAGDSDNDEDQAERVLHPGDWIVVRRTVLHDEHTATGVRMVVAHTGPFETFPGPPRPA